MRKLLLGIALVVLAGCDVLGIGKTCTSELAWGVSLVLEDSATGGPVVADEIRVVAQDGAYVEERDIDPNPPNPGPVSIVEDRSGTYRITVVASGYAPWVQDGIQVGMEDECHVRTVSLEARLQPSEP